MFLNISHNRLDSIQPGALQESQFLEVIDLSYNVLDNSGLSLDVFENKLIKELYMRGNALERVPDVGVDENQLLEILDLGGCLISTIPKESFSAFISLKTLYLDELNVLSSVEEDAFAGLVSLEELILSDNPQLSLLPAAALPDDGLVGLQTLRLNNNSLTKLDQDLFVNKVSLETVTIHGNPLRCSCDVSWMRRQMDDDQLPWIQPWKTGYTAAVCDAPLHFAGIEVYEFSSEDLTCDLPVVAQSTELLGDDRIYEVKR